MKKVWILCTLVLTMVLATACGSEPKKEPASDASTPKIESRQFIEAFGTVKSSEIKNIVIDFPASVENIHVNEGQKVKKGDPLLTLTMDEFQAQIKDKESELVILKEQGTGSNAQKERISSLERNIQLLKNKTDQSYFKDTDIISDIPNGLVFEIGYAPGDLVSPAKKLLSIMDLDHLIVEANVSEEFIKDVKVGSTATIVPVADKTKEYRGKVSYISDRAYIVNGDSTIPVQISIDNLDAFLLPGFNVDIQIDME